MCKSGNLHEGSLDVTGPYPDAPKRENFHWSEETEPHAMRRKAILSKHPEIRDLFGPNVYIMHQVFAVVGAQTAVAYAIGHYGISWYWIFAISYAFGAFCNHNLFLAVHELAHSLAFESATANRALGFVANLPTIFPFAVTFQKYHLEHHQHQGVDNVDMDVPTYWEGSWALNAVSKTVWVSCQLFFYALRPLFVKPKPAGLAEFLNLVVCLAYDYAMYRAGGLKAVAYLLLSTFLGGGLHPIAGHFISEHYVFKEGQETFSYYGPLNWIIYNAGYHNEHHDFPRIPGSRLKQVYEAAPEFYDDLAYHTSWSGCIFRYIMDPSVGPFSRVRRTTRVPSKAQ